MTKLPDPFDLQAYRDSLDEDYEADAPISRRARWLGNTEDGVLSVLIVVAVVAFVVAVVVLPIAGVMKP